MFVSGRRKSNGNERSKSEGTDEIYKSVNLTRPDGHEWENLLGDKTLLAFRVSRQLQHQMKKLNKNTRSEKESPFVPLNTIGHSLHQNRMRTFFAYISVVIFMSVILYADRHGSIRGMFRVVRMSRLGTILIV